MVLEVFRLWKLQIKVHDENHVQDHLDHGFVAHH